MDQHILQKDVEKSRSPAQRRWLDFVTDRLENRQVFRALTDQSVRSGMSAVGPGTRVSQIDHGEQRR